MLEQAAVILIVLAAAAYTAWYICPANLRLALVQRLQRRCQQSPAAKLMPSIVRAAAVPTGACAGCGARSRCPVGRGIPMHSRPVGD